MQTSRCDSRAGTASREFRQCREETCDDGRVNGPETLIGKILQGRYRVDSELGEGGMGSVYRAEHVALGRSVAVKVLRDELAGSEEFRLRFEREATVLSGLSHPNIVSVLDYGFEEGLPFLVMEFLEGRDLDDVLTGGRLSASRAESIAKQLLLAVGHAHTHGLVHRDLKPQNVVVRELADGNEHVSVLDFGLARQVEGGAKVTKTGLLMGTPAYMSPEQATGGKTDARSDVYSLGVMFYELFGGQHPFAEEDSHALLRAHLIKEPPPLAALSVGPQIAALVAKALSKEPAARFCDANAMLEAWGAELIEELARATDVETRVGKRSGDSAPSAPSYEDSTPSGSAPSSGPLAQTSKPPKAKWGLAAGALVVLTFVIALSLSGDDDADVPVVPIPPGVSVSASTEDSVPVVPAPIQPEAQRVSIWEGDSSYADILAQLRRGDALRRRQQRSLAVSARRAPNDARPLLLLAHSYVVGRSLSDGMERYEAALAINPRAAAEEWTAGDLITIAAAESLHSRATRLILQHYDADFAARVEERAVSERGPWRQRLQALAQGLRNENRR